jgi:hypothetical protein
MYFMAERMLTEGRLRIFQITRPGLIALTLAVSALWGCLASERIATKRASDDLRVSLRKIALLRNASGSAIASRSSFLL